MKGLTVAQRIYGGFAVLLALLIVVIALNVIKLGQIESSTRDINETALPVIETSAKLTQLLLRLKNSADQIYFANGQSQVAKLNGEFAALNQEFSNKIKQSQGRSGVSGAIRQHMSQIEELHEAFTFQNNSIVNHRNLDFALEQQASETIESARSNADEAAILLLDLADLDEIQANTDLLNAVSTGDRIETSLITVLDVSNKGLKEDKPEVLTNSHEDLKFMISDISSNFQFLKGQLAGIDSAQSILTKIEEYLQKVDGAILAESQGVFALLRQRLSEKQSAANAKQTLDQSVTQELQLLEDVQREVDKYAENRGKEVEDAVSSTRTITLMLMVISIVIGVGTAIYTVGTITRPLQRVNQVLSYVAEGDMTQTVDTSSHDEFGKLANSCNQLICSLKSLIEAIASKSEDLFDVSESSTRVSNQTAECVERETRYIDEVATQTTQLNEISRLVDTDARESFNQVSTANEQAENIEKLAGESKFTIEQLAEDVRGAVSAIEELDENVTSISSILEVIGGVAEQTNLLALNAAIEAARAGEQGRGFAVVADEVRALASRTQQATAEIRQVIENLQNGAKHAVGAMAKGNEKVEDCVSYSARTTEGIVSINSALTTACDSSQRIADSAAKLQSISNEIDGKLERIVAFAHETADGASETCRTNDALVSTTEDLKRSISKFKIV